MQRRVRGNPVAVSSKHADVPFLWELRSGGLPQGVREAEHHEATTLVEVVTWAGPLWSDDVVLFSVTLGVL